MLESSALGPHMRLVHSTTDHLCTYCGNSFKNINILRNHIKTKHELTERYPCKNCDKKFKTNYDMKYHFFEVHKKVKPLKCPIPGCLAVVASAKSLYLHNLNIHSNREFKCSQCEKVFNQRANLRVHVLQVHEKITVPCSHCQKALSSKEKKNLHEAKCPHVVCFFCKKALSSVRNKNVHEETCLFRPKEESN